jgi:hypothetical protein
MIMRSSSRYSATDQQPIWWPRTPCVEIPGCAQKLRLAYGHAHRKDSVGHATEERL